MWISNVPTEPDQTNSYPDRGLRASTRPADQTGFVSPIVRKLLDQHSIHISRIEEPDWRRVTKDDVLSYIERGGAGAAGVAPGPIVNCTSGD